MKSALSHILLCLCAISLEPTHLMADVKLQGVFTDYCVLQRDMPLPIWGTAEPGENITVELAGRRAKTVANQEGHWKAQLEPIPAGGPFTLKVNGKNLLEIKDVLIGEVWIGVGQSNMMMGIAAVDGGPEALARAGDYPMLRMAHETGPKLIQDQPTEDIKVTWGPPAGGSSAVSYFFAERLYQHFDGKVPVGLLNFTEIRPAESWCDPDLVKKDPKIADLAGAGYPHDTGKLFNGVVQPVAPFAVRGVLYYQGEMNSGDALAFREIFPTVIKSWRHSWERDSLPFLFVQLPGFQEHRGERDSHMDMDEKSLSAIHKAGQDHGYAFIREAQLETYRNTLNVGMAVTIDVGEAWDIHPRNKRTVGERLFLQARRVAYGDEKVVASGPIAKNVEFKAPQVIVDFDTAGSRLVSRGDKLEGFELAGTDRKFHPAVAKIDGNKIVLSSKDVPEPVMVHYAWAGFPQADLFNADGLPASPFRWYRYDRLSTAGQAEFRFADENFTNEGAKRSWALIGGAEIKKLQDGSAVAMLSQPGAAVGQDNPSARLGYIWNADPFAPLVARPGSVAGYSIEAAAGPGKGPAEAYLRLANDLGAVGCTETWGLPSPAPVESERFTQRHRAHLLQGNSPQPSSSIGIFLANNPGSHRPLMLRKISPVTILRPLLEFTDSAPISLGKLPRGKIEDSKPLTISNGQKQSLPDLLTESGEPRQVFTVLYGLADVKHDGKGKLQQVLKPSDNVGAVLIGKDADRFAFASEHATEDQRGLKFLGNDGKPGLTGGSPDETESFSIRFLGSSEPGQYQATLRLVTQAGNIGTLSRGAPEEPPVNLYYLDISITAVVQ